MKIKISQEHNTYRLMPGKQLHHLEFHMEPYEKAGQLNYLVIITVYNTLKRNCADIELQC